ncbi:MAG: DNA gyrase inhibitor YacG [Rhizomicrobium sp.]
MSPPVEGGGSCPICGKPRDAKFKPFCSKRCADLDLAKWLRGEYTIPGAPIDEAEPAPEPDEDAELH